MSKKQLIKQDFWYNLPKELIAQTPIEPRDSSRLFVYDRSSGQVEHKKFFDIADYLESGDLLVLNNTKVMPARLLGLKKMTGGKVEVFLLTKLANKKDTEIWQVMLGGKVGVGLEIVISSGLSAVVQQNNQDGTWAVEFNLAGSALKKQIEEVGHMPLPPYIRHGEDKNEDRQRYQTVFARTTKKNSVAAPTAGLHFTKDLLVKLKKQGVQIGELTLHVGIGTFAPVKADKITDHRMHAESYEVDKKLLEKIIETKKRGGRVIAVGTTSARTLETVANRMDKGEWTRENGLTGVTDIFIYPGYQFKLVDALITNFHLPESTLLMLLAAFLDSSTGSARAGQGLKIEKKLYTEAIKNKYRFFSYGDAMLIL